MVSLEGLSVSPQEAHLLARPSVGGLILFTRNFQDRAQLTTLISSLRAINQGLLIAVDQEGGRVQRFREGFLSLPPLARLGALHGKDEQAGLDAAEVCGWAMAIEQVAAGLDFSFAPVLDVYTEASRVIGDRAFSEDPAVLTLLAERYIAGMDRAGMAATGKHFPGHGTVAGDSHVELPVDSRSLDALLSHDLIPFAGLARQLRGIMPAHVIYPAVDSVCAGFSKIWLQDLLRTQLHFEGVIFSDDLTMDAALSAGSIEQRASLAFSAGCDMVLVCNDNESASRVADHLDSNPELVDPASQPRLRAMTARREVVAPDYSNSEEWQQAVALIESLVE